MKRRTKIRSALIVVCALAAVGVAGPKLFVAGALDRHTALEESRRLFAAAREPKELWVVEGAAHTDLHAAAREEYERRVLDFFDRNLRP